MDFTNIRQLIYRERKNLDEFDILNDDKSKITPFLYDRLIHIDYLHPKHKYTNEEILRILNDVFFYHTLFFKDDNPLAHYADYQQISNPDNSSDTLSKNRQWVEMAIAYVILNRFNGVEWFREKKSHARFFDFIKEEIEKHRRAYMYSMLTAGEGAAIEDKIINTITSDCEGRRFIMIINEDFPLRDIQEIIDSRESLQNCLLAGGELRGVVDMLCMDNEQKMQLIDRLLEPEKEHYGVFDSTIRAAYRSLYELKSELTGEPLPEQLPFEKASICTPPMMATPPSFLDYQKENKADDRDARIAELEKEVGALKEELSKFQYATDDDVAEIFNDDEQGEPQGSKLPQAEKQNTESDSQPQELTDALKKIEEQAQTIQEQKAVIERLNTLNEVIDKQLKRYQDEEASTEDLDEKKKLEIDERIIFVSALLGVSLKPEVVNQTQLAKLIEKLTGDTWQSIRPRISSINSEAQQVIDKTIKQFSEGTQSAAKNVYELINKAVKGATRENKGYQCKQAMENINQTYQLSIKM